MTDSPRLLLGTLVSVATLLAALVLAPLALAATPTSFIDPFPRMDYSGDTGLSQWATPWIESGESDGPNNGWIHVSNRRPCAVGFCLDLEDTDGTEVSITRGADLSGYSQATVAFTYQRHLHRGPGTGTIRFEVRRTGGTWTTLRTYALTADDASPVQQNFDISSLAAGPAEIRFRVVGGGSSHHLMVDNVTLVAFGSPTTTTTAVTTTTTTPSATTSTTTTTTRPTPPTTTTTTTRPTPPTTTTTTTAVTTTTTTPGTTTSTTTAPATTTTSTTSVPASNGGGGSPVAPTTPTTTSLPPGPIEVAVATLNAPVLDLSARSTRHATADNSLGESDQSASLMQAASGLMAGYSTAVEGAAGSLIPIAILALIVAWVSIRGLDVAERRKAPRRSRNHS